MKLPKAPKSLPHILALVGWGLALALAVHSYTRPLVPPSPLLPELSREEEQARAMQHQVEPLLEAAREKLALGSPDRALSQVADAFTLCRAYDQRPPVECYEVFVDALTQTMAAQPKAPARPSIRIDSPRAAYPVAVATNAAPQQPVAFVPPDAPPLRPYPLTPETRQSHFSLPRPEYPLARPSREPEGQGEGEGPGHCPPPPPNGDWGPPPPPPQGERSGMRRQPIKDWRSSQRPDGAPGFPPPPSGDMRPGSKPPGPPPMRGSQRQRGNTSSYPGPPSDQSLPPYPPEQEDQGIPGY